MRLPRLQPTSRWKTTLLAGGLRDSRGERGRVDGGGSAVVYDSIELLAGSTWWACPTVGAAAAAHLPGGRRRQRPPAGPADRTRLQQPHCYAPVATNATWTCASSRPQPFSTGSPFQQATFNLHGASLSTQPAAPIDASPTDYGHAGWGVSGVSLQLDGGATRVCVETLNVTWNNDLDTDLYCLNDGGQRHDLPEGEVLVSGDGVAQFDTPALREGAGRYRPGAESHAEARRQARAPLATNNWN